MEDQNLRVARVADRRRAHDRRRLQVDNRFTLDAIQLREAVDARDHAVVREDALHGGALARARGHLPDEEARANRAAVRQPR